MGPMGLMSGWIHMWMSENQLIAEFVADIGDVEVSCLRAYLGVEDDVEEHVAELLADVILVILDDGISQLVGLLNRIGAQALVGLLTVPRALLPQVVHDVEQTSESR